VGAGDGALAVGGWWMDGGVVSDFGEACETDGGS